MMKKAGSMDREKMEMVLEKVNRRDNEAQTILNQSVKYKRKPLNSEIEKASKLLK